MPDDIIDEAAVRISPDLSKFRADLKKKLAAATKGVEGRVRLVADATGWTGSVKAALKGHRERYGLPEAKVRLVADATGWTSSVDKALKGRKSPTVKVDVDKDSATRAAKNVDSVFKKIDGSARVLATTIDKQISKSLRDSFLLPGGSEPLTKALSRARSEREKFQSAELEAVDRVGKARDKELGGEIARIGKSLHLQLSATKAESAARESALDDYYKDLQRVFDLQRGGSKAEAKRLANEAAEAERAASAARAEAIETQRKSSAFLSFQDKVNSELHKMRGDAADDERHIADETAHELARIDRVRLSDRITNLTAIEKAERESNRRNEAAQKESVARRKAASGSFLKATEANGIIDFGGQGIRPGNIPIAALVALSPALLSIASSATLASSSIAAIGAAGLGAVAGVTALVVGFGRIREALTLREQVRKEEARATASTAENAAAERSRAQAIVQANRSVRDSIYALADARRSAIDADRTAAEARAGINTAYKEAAQYVKDLREELSDLALQEEQDTLDVASAREKAAAVNRNFWSTDLEKRQANLDIQKALDRQGDTKRDQVGKRKELNKLDREGLGHSKQVLDAKKRSADADRSAADAHRAVIRAAEGVADAQIRLTEAKRKDAPASVAASAAAQDLAAKIAAMSPAARKMYYWFDKNQGKLDKLRAKMEQAVLPGFLKFLDAVTDTNKGKSKSTLEIMADSAATLGEIIGDTVGDLGELTKSKWFRKDLVKINGENEKSFKLLGKTALTLVKPFTAIIAAASPLFTKFSKWLLDVSTQFADFIDKHVKDGTLVQWFKDAGTELGKWKDIAKNLLSFVKDIFTTSLPTGKDLVSRIRDATKALAGWSAKPENQKKLLDFFEKFKNIDYGKLTKFVVQVGLLIGALKLFTFSRKHPFYLLMGLLAAKYPEATATFLDKVAGTIGTTLGWINKYPVAAATTLAILTALTKAKSVSVGLKVLGLTGLASKFTAFSKIFGGTASAGVMHVNAGVVHINGPTVGGGGGPSVITKGNKGSKVPGLASKGIGLGGIGTVIATGILAIDAVVYHPDKIKRFFTMDLPNWLTEGERGWSSFENATENTFGKGFVKWWSHTLPDSLNLGEGTGWSGLAGNLGHWFSATLPDAISGTPGGGWSGAGTYVKDQFKEFIGWNTVTGVWDGITEKSSWLWGKVKQFWKWLVDSTKDVLGIASPSTVFAEIGGNLVDGLWKGFTGKWSGLVETAKKYISSAIGGPLKVAFKSVGEGARNVFVGPFDTLTSKLAAPVGKALDWIDTNVIDKLNAVLSKIGIPSKIPNIDSTLGDGGKETPSRTGMGSKPAKMTGTKGAQMVRKKADGGLIGGTSPHSRADNIPAMLTAREYVQPVDTVKHYGVGFMDALRRKEIPRLADGGLVGSMYGALGGKNFITSAAAGTIKAMGGDTIAAIAASVRNALGGGIGALFGPGTPVPGFGNWPSSAGAVHGHDSGIWRAIVKLVDTNHIPRGSFGAYNNRRTLRGGWSWHASGHAVDFSGFDQDELAEFFMNRKPSVLELIHSTKKRNYGISRGHEHDMGSALWSQHKNHLHVAMADGGLVPNVPMRKYDSGGGLPPGVTLAVNNTGRTERVLTAGQDNNRTDTAMRIDPRDLAALARQIGAAFARLTVTMDGRRVGELVRGYDHLPGGI